ncbi:laccase domain protein [Shewanella sp. NFH-SH190041]|uniref:peptidoglycan editing factor PgeF n=1 Tax=Shewanella sp. NFH-SH190041 TaxID=2950245 RepID=UPI0021C43FE3|nr:peptidoglycan editing factor PgeF [Shewanella sp. NFH-SH190041]BDM65672.1 laccase domain protein [Shewanella sp. NFH-SH190041]
MITWAVPDNVGFAVSNREGGVSLPPFDSLNLGLHVDDNPEAVRENRRRVQHHFAMPAAPSWLDQVHSTKVVQLPLTASCQADASYTRCAGQVCVVMTADCLPVLLCNRQGTEVAAIHAGWRGLCQGIIENTLGHFSAPAEEIMALTGPAIGPTAFEVGPEVREAFMAYSPAAAQAFIPAAPGKYMANLEQLAVQRLNHAGVTDIHCTSLCTYTLSDKYFSYRKSPVTGRFASFIWLKS